MKSQHRIVDWKYDREVVSGVLSSLQGNCKYRCSFAVCNVFTDRKRNNGGRKRTENRKTNSFPSAITSAGNLNVNRTIEHARACQFKEFQKLILSAYPRYPTFIVTSRSSVFEKREPHLQHKITSLGTTFPIRTSMCAFRFLSFFKFTLPLVPNFIPLLQCHKFTMRKDAMVRKWQTNRRYEKLEDPAASSNPENL